MKRFRFLTVNGLFPAKFGGASTCLGVESCWLLDGGTSWSPAAAFFFAFFSKRSVVALAVCQGS